MTLRLIILAALIFTPLSGYCAWARIEIAEVRGRIYSLTTATVLGKPALVFAGDGGSVNFLRWIDGSWSKESVPLPFSNVSALAAGSWQPSGWPYIYAGSYTEQRILELRHVGAGWTMTDVEVPGIATWGIVTTLSRVDGKPRVIVRRLDLPKDHGSAPPHSLYECTAPSGAFHCLRVGGGGWLGPFVVNPPGARPYDLIIANSVYTKKTTRDPWTVIGSYSANFDAAASRVRSGVLYSDGAETLFTEGFKLVAYSPLPDIPTRFASVSPGCLHPDGIERVYRGAEDKHIYETTKSSGGWRMTDIGGMSGIPERMIAAALKSDGRERLYVAETKGLDEIGSGSTISEYTYFDRVTVVTVAPFLVDKETAGAESTVGRMLAQVFRTELSAFGHIQVVESESAEEISAEREFQRRNCIDAECISRLGRTMRAEAVISGTARRSGGSLSLLLTMQKVGEKAPVLSISRTIANEFEIAAALHTAARDMAQRWPHDFSPKVGD